MTDARAIAQAFLDSDDTRYCRNLRTVCEAYLATLTDRATLQARAETAEAGLRPFTEAFAKHRIRYTRAKSDWFDKMPGEWPVDLTVTMADGRNAEAELQAWRQAAFEKQHPDLRQQLWEDTLAVSIHKLLNDRFDTDCVTDVGTARDVVKLVLASLRPSPVVDTWNCGGCGSSWSNAGDGVCYICRPSPVVEAALLGRTAVKAIVTFAISSGSSVRFGVDARDVEALEEAVGKALRDALAAHGGRDGR